MVITEKGRIVDINDQALKLFGCQRDEMVGREVVEFVPPEMRELVADRIREHKEGAYEHLLLRKGSGPFHAEAQAKVMRMGDRVLRMTALRDVTERRKNEQRQKNLEEQVRQMQKMEALGTLAGGIAHDFNNILTGILGYLQLAEMDLTREHPAYAAVESADKASCCRARDLVARILSFSRLEQEKPPSFAPLGPVVAEAVQLLESGHRGQHRGPHRDRRAACPPSSSRSGPDPPGDHEPRDEQLPCDAHGRQADRGAAPPPPHR